MDSFFSLFDPSEGAEKPPAKTHNMDQNDKKKGDMPKGRRRGRKCQGKSETLPEESSFLCEPELSTELLVKGGSYIDSFIELNKKDDDTWHDSKPRRRNSGRRSRRRRSGASPRAGGAGGAPALNNTAVLAKCCAGGGVGKNVNDLSGGGAPDDDHDSDDMEMCDQSAVYRVIQKLEKVGLKDDSYLAGDFDTAEIGDECCGADEPYSDTASEPDDSSDEAHGSLPPEPRFGNVEYKLQLVAPCEKRFQHLVTQLKWRLRSGGGSALYVVGVRDCGALRGLRPAALRASLHTLRRMCAALSARLAHVAARRVAPRRAVAEVYVRKLADTHQSVELRVAVMGANEAGKSTLIGVLTQGELDNGRGSARLNMFRHLHEVKSGRTSSLSHEILGFDAQGNVVNYGCSELMTAERIGERSAKLVSFLDLAGHSKYQRTTLHGLTGYSPHCALLVISATAGITRITEEHIGLLLALDLPFSIVITKCELAPAAKLQLMARLTTILQPANKKPVLITDEDMARNCAAPQKSVLDSLDSDNENEPLEEDDGCVGVFPVSCVRGAGLRALHAHLRAAPPAPPAPAPAPSHEPVEFQIDEIFHVGDSEGPVVGGLLARGCLREGDNLIMGPLEDGSFCAAAVRTVYRNRVRCAGATRGQCASLGLRAPAPRAGMVLLAPPRAHPAHPATPARYCACSAAQLASLLQNQTHENAKNRKNVRRKNKNLLQDLAAVESSLIKVDTLEDTNTYRSDNECDKIDRGDNNNLHATKCVCKDAVMLEDPNDPRGCMFFQATVQVLRHSTAIWPGFQCTVHVGNVRQTAIIEGIMSRNSELRAGQAASVVFRFTRCPEYVVCGRRVLLTAGLGTRAIGRVTQTFPYYP